MSTIITVEGRHFTIHVDEKPSLDGIALVLRRKGGKLAQTLGTASNGVTGVIFRSASKGWHLGGPRRLNGSYKLHAEVVGVLRNYLTEVGTLYETDLRTKEQGLPGPQMADADLLKGPCKRPTPVQCN